MVRLRTKRMVLWCLWNFGASAAEHGDCAAVGYGACARICVAESFAAERGASGTECGACAACYTTSAA